MLHLGCLPLAGNLLSSCTLDTKEIHLKLLSVQQRKDGKSLSNQVTRPILCKAPTSSIIHQLVAQGPTQRNVDEVDVLILSHLQMPQLATCETLNGKTQLCNAL